MPLDRLGPRRRSWGVSNIGDEATLGPRMDGLGGLCWRPSERASGAAWLLLLAYTCDAGTLGKL